MQHKIRSDKAVKKIPLKPKEAIIINHTFLKEDGFSVINYNEYSGCLRW